MKHWRYRKECNIKKKKKEVPVQEGDIGGSGAHFLLYAEFTVTHRPTLSERGPETNKKPTVPTSKWVGQAETHSCHKHHTWHSKIPSGGNSQIPASP